MRRLLLLPLLLGTTTLASTAFAAAQAPVLEKVTISTAGLGYFEHTAEVEDDGTIRLSVPFEQVDDILKSLIVSDPTGQVLRVTLPGREPDLSAIADLPVPAEALGSIDSLLMALNGQEVMITGNRTARGRVVSLQERMEPQAEGKPSVARRTLALMTGDGLLEIPLTEGLSVQPADPALAGRINEAMRLIALAKEKGSRELSITVAGKGKRAVKFGYVAAAPLWKSSYRLDLAGNGTEGRLQGWAILENKSGQDWKDVKLTLSAGNPVAFRQELYRSYLADRPVVAIDLPNRILPPVDEGSVQMEMMTKSEAPLAMAAPAPAMAPSMAGASRDRSQSADMSAGYGGLGNVATAAAADGETQIDLTLPTNVSVPAGQSLMVPITDRTLPAKSTLVYRPGEQAATAAVDLTNSSDTSLPPGALTLYRGGAYVGDGRLALLPKGDTRFIAYAQDGRLQIQSDRADTVQLTNIKASRGVLTLERRAETSLTVKIKAPAGETRPLLIELPKSGGTLDTPPSGSTETPTAWRVPVTLKPGETVTLPLTTSRVLSQRVIASDFDPSTLLASAEGGKLPEKSRASLVKLAELRRAVTDAATAATQAQTRQESLANDQERLRENLGAVPANSDLAKRYLKQLSDSEDQIGKQVAAEENAQKAHTTAKAALDDFIAKLDL
ncbi:DUF4139 domain-containing protein [Lacibacterium aquatile]|uniref:DUF4139 domain-containing protein n=1 Tax=Lacibacterium aquatile TaxID=1168082 RepID=A0ABW5DLR4_9PROT